MSHRQRKGEEKEDVDMIRFRKTFEELSGQDMEVDAWELRDILNSSLRQDLRRDRFSQDSCKSMVALSDEDRTGKLSFDEFRELWDSICEWRELFKKADTDNSGMISTNEMRASLTSLGFKLKNDTFRALGLLYGNKEGNLSFASFIHVAIRVKFMYTTFESRSRGDKARFNLEEFRRAEQSVWQRRKKHLTEQILGSEVGRHELKDFTNQWPCLQLRSDHKTAKVEELLRLYILEA